MNTSQAVLLGPAGVRPALHAHIPLKGFRVRGLGFKLGGV